MFSHLANFTGSIIYLTGGFLLLYPISHVLDKEENNNRINIFIRLLLL